MVQILTPLRLCIVTKHFKKDIHIENVVKSALISRLSQCTLKQKISKCVDIIDINSLKTLHGFIEILLLDGYLI